VMSLGVMHDWPCQYIFPLLPQFGDDKLTIQQAIKSSLVLTETVKQFSQMFVASVGPWMCNVRI
jgi:hypothetical protein